jgi:hypothetical protein
MNRSNMRISSKRLVVFLLSVFLGTLYAFVVGLISKNMDGPLISWPIWIAVFWFIFWKFNFLRFVGFIAALPIALLAFESLWTLRHPGMNAEVYKAFDRSHYTPGLRFTATRTNEADHPRPSGGARNILIGKDGFRADPETEEGNPDRCQFALIGDSMIYGSGLPYTLTLGPILRRLGLHPCVFGVTGNSPVDYLSTLKYVGDRIEPGAYVVFYLYAYNDFVSLNKYVTRGFLTTSNRFQRLFQWSFYFDQWRQTTWTYSLVHTRRAPPQRRLWQYQIGQGEPIKILYTRDPGQYVTPEPLNDRQRLALKFFFTSLNEVARGHSWRIVIVIHPDDAEIYANFARRSQVFMDMDPRRADGLSICKEFSFVCEDMSRYIYERSIAAGENPYFPHDRHFSPFGTRIVAEHFLALTRRVR